MPVVAGVDSSTQSCTVVLYHDSGALLASASAPHPGTTAPGSEQDPRAWWIALSRALEEACMSARVRAADIAALSVAAQHHGLVPLGSGGDLLRPARLWNDTTSAPQADRLVARLGIEAWLRRTGSVPSAAFTISKLAWLSENEPATFAALRMSLLPHDWLTLQLTGVPVTDRADASGTGYFDPAADAWCPELLALVDPNRDWLAQLPQVLGPEDIAGPVRAAPGLALGLSPEALVGAGTGDQSAAALGLNLQEGDVLVSVGTSGVVTGVSPHPVMDPLGRVNGTASASGTYQPVVVTLNAAKVTDMFARLLGVDHGEMSRLALATERGGAGRPTLVPYLDGERTPDRPTARGLLTGFSSDLTRESLALCAFEGVTLGLLQGREVLIEAGLPVGGRFLLTGGASGSAAYRRSFAALSGLTVHVPDIDGGLVSAKGAAIQAAAVMSGVTVNEVAEAWKPRLDVASEPVPGDAAYATERWEQYRRSVAVQQPSEAPLLSIGDRH
jgi:xylulokinase